MGDGRCPICNGKLMVDQGEIRCTSCDYHQTLQEHEKSLPHDISSYSDHELFTILVTTYNVEAQLKFDCIALVNALGNPEEMVDAMGSLYNTLEQLKIKYNLSEQDLDRYKRAHLKRLLERSGIL
jgi:uncharacterized Zn finger protein (UPF0148 family)